MQLHYQPGERKTSNEYLVFGFEKECRTHSINASASRLIGTISRLSEFFEVREVSSDVDHLALSFT